MALTLPVRASTIINGAAIRSVLLMLALAVVVKQRTQNRLVFQAISHRTASSKTICLLELVFFYMNNFNSKTTKKNLLPTRIGF
jgi:hypothetical protein